MPKYFFHLVASGKSLPDEEGTELSDVTDARELAASSAREIIEDLSAEGFDLSTYAFNVTNDRGEEVMIFEFKMLLNGSAH